MDEDTRYVRPEYSLMLSGQFFNILLSATWTLHGVVSTPVLISFLPMQTHRAGNADQRRDRIMGFWSRVMPSAYVRNRSA